MMRWTMFSNFKYYASAAIALVGLSAASTVLTDRTSLAQQPTSQTTNKVVDETQAEIDEVQVEIKALSEALGADHPKVKELRKQIEQAKTRLQKERLNRQSMIRDPAKLEQAKAQLQKAREAQEKASEEYRRVIVQNVGGNTLSLAEVAIPDDQVVTEEIQGNRSVVVRRTADGKTISEVLTTGPREVRGISLLGNPKQNSDLQEAFEKLKGKETSEADKAAAKEKIMSILGEQFDEDLEQRGKQIAELEKKVVALKEQIGKRKDARKRLIDLRMELLMNESEGLGFPSSWQQPAGVGPLGLSLNPLTETRTIVGVLPPSPPQPPAPPQPPRLATPPQATSPLSTPESSELK